MKRQLLSSQDKLSRLQTYSQLKRAKVEEKLVKLREEYGITHSERAAVQAKMDESQAISKEVEEKVSVD